MIYDCNIDFDINRAKTRFEQLLNKRKKIKLEEITTRSIQQNSYLHLIIGWFSIEYGDTLEYCKKEFYKKTCNKELFEFEKTNKFTGEISKDYKSSKELTKDQMTLSIERFRNYSSKNGIYLPSADEKNFLESISFELKKHEKYM